MEDNNTKPHGDQPFFVYYYSFSKRRSNMICMDEGIEKEEVNTDCLYTAIIEYMHTHTYTCNTDLLYE